MKLYRGISSVVLLGLTLWLGYGVDRADFPGLLTAYGIFFAVYLWIIARLAKEPGGARWFIGTGIVLRACLLFSLPNLSDDFYRFLWDGHLILEGIHPFAHAPAYFAEQGNLPNGLTAEWYARLNSPQYHTVYPPVCQAVFALAAWLAPNGWWAGVVVIKVFLFAAELGALFLLRRSWPSAGPFQVDRAVLYALNPLVILEIMGNAHFDGAMIFFLLLGLRSLAHASDAGGGRKAVPALAAAWAFATAAKLLPPLFIPLAWRKLGWTSGLWFVLLFSGMAALLFVPLLDVGVLLNMTSSLGLYFQKFAFNASVFYLLRYGGLWLENYPLVLALGRLLGFATLAGVLLLAWRGLKPGASFGQLATCLLWASCLYLLNSSTVHPWYVMLPFTLSLFTTWRFPLAWTGLVILSYSHYDRGGYVEHFGWIVLEYLGVMAVGALEWYRYRRLQSPTRAQ